MTQTEQQITTSTTEIDDQPKASVVAQRALIGLMVLIGVLAILGGLGTFLVFDGAIGSAEADAVGWIAEHRLDVLDSAATIGSSFSDTWTVIGVIVGAGSMLWAAGHPRHALTIALAVLLEFATFLAVGALVDRPRPDVEALGSVPSTPSFPSGHVAAAFVLYGSLVLIARSVSSRPISRMLWLVPIMIAVVVAASRVYEGVHHPTDVAAGLLLGVGALIAAAHATGVKEAAWLSDRRTRSNEIGATT